MLIFCKPYDDFWVVCRKTAPSSLSIYTYGDFRRIRRFFKIALKIGLSSLYIEQEALKNLAP
jgi:hypothetical protein